MDENTEQEPIEQEPSADRPIEELLKLPTFQGMSDGEISKIIDYTATRAANEAVHAAHLAEIEERTERDVAAWKALKASGDALMQSIIDSAPQLEVVEDE